MIEAWECDHIDRIPSPKRVCERARAGFLRVARNLLGYPDPVRRPFSSALRRGPAFHSGLCAERLPRHDRGHQQVSGPLPRANRRPERDLRARCGDSICHDAQNPEADLDLISPNLERRLVGVRSTQCARRLRIDRTDPERSFLLEKLDRDDQECGDRMPVGGDPLSRDLIACVRDWVQTVAAQSTGDAAAPEPDSQSSGASLAGQPDGASEISVVFARAFARRRARVRRSPPFKPRVRRRLATLGRSPR